MSKIDWTRVALGVACGLMFLGMLFDPVLQEACGESQVERCR